MSAAVERVLAAYRARGVEPTRSGDGWSAPCLAHDDHKPSLTINTGNEGRALLRCHTGCAVESVAAAIGLTMADLMPDRATATRQIEAYDYTDEAGKSLFQVVRFEPKDFRQRHPDGHGGWNWNIKGVRRVLYRLPAVVAAAKAGQTILVVEGEKDVHAAERAGAVATTNPGGAGNGKWRPEYSESLRGAHVVVVADRDKAGRDHARAVAVTLEGIAASVRVVEAAVGKDLHDHLNAGKSIEGLIDLPSDPRAPAAAAAPSLDDSDTSDASVAFERLPTFPLDALSPTVQRITLHFANAVEAKPDLVVPAVLAALSAALGPEWKVGARAFIRPALLWFVLVATSGSSKTPATKPALAPLHDEDRRLGDAYKVARKNYARELRDWKKSKKGEGVEEPDEPLRTRAGLTDITPEGIVAALAGSPRGVLVHSDELAQLLNSLDTYHARPGRGRATFLALWSGNRVAEARKTAKENEVENPFTVIFGGIQQSVLCSMQLADGDGLCGRFLYGIVRGKPGGLGQHMDPLAVDLWTRIIALALGHRVLVVQFFDEGGIALLDQKLRYWKQRANDLDDASYGLLGSMYAKAGDHCVRLAAVLHGMDAIEASLTHGQLNPPALAARTVPRATVERAVRLVEYYLAHGAAVARLVVMRPADPESHLAGDRDIAKHLRALVGPGEEVTDSPTGWMNRLAERGVRVSPSKLGRALVRLEAGGPADLRVERQARGENRGWRVHRPARASEATEASGSPDSIPWGVPDASDPSDGCDGGRSRTPDTSPTLPTPAPPSVGTEDDPSATAAVASDTSDASTSGPPPDSAERWSGTRRLFAAEHAEETICRALGAGDEGTAWWAVRALAAVIGMEQAEAVADDIRSEMGATADAA